MATGRIIRGKVIGGGLGMLLAGPLGAALGVWLGHVFDRRAMRRRSGAGYAMRREAAAAAVVVLAAKLAKADRVVTSHEILTFRRLFHIPDREAKRVAVLWDKARATPLGYEPYAVQLAQMFADCPAMRRRIMELLWAVAMADGQVGPDERRMLDDIARLLDLGRARSGPTGLARPWPGTTHVDDAERVMAEMFADPRAAGAAVSARIECWIERAGQLIRALSAHSWTRPTIAALNAGVAFLIAYHFAPIPFSLPGGELALSGGLAGLCWLGSMATLPRARSLQDELKAMAGDSRIDVDRVAGVIEQGRARIAAIRTAMTGLPAAIARRIERICEIAERIVDELRADPADVARTQPFLDHYLAGARELVERYAALHGRAADTPRLGEIQARFEPLLEELETLFVKQYQRIVENEARSLDLEIDVLSRMIKAEGA